MRKRWWRRRRVWLLGFSLVTAMALLVVTVVAMEALTVMDARIVKAMNGPKWDIPARVYGRPMELYVGGNTTQAQLERELVRLGYRRDEAIGPGRYDVLGSRVLVQTRGFRFADGPEPARRLQFDWGTSGLTAIEDGRGDPVDLVRLEPPLIGRISPDESEDRLLVGLDQLPETLLDTLLAVEDTRFYSHPGLSVRGIARAMLTNLRAGRFVAGGSTITQQLIKNLFLTSDRTLKRKLTEWPMALLLERRYSKDDILTAFINEVYFAQDRSRAVHGFGLASLHFFGVPVQELQHHQIALLVGLLKGPSYYDPVRRPERARARRDVVLKVMRRDNIIDRAAFERAITQPISVAAGQRGTSHPAFLDVVRTQLLSDYDLADLQQGGFSVFTGFDPRVQRELEDAVASRMAVFDAAEQAGGSEQTPLELAAVVTSVANGEVLALLGGRAPRYAGYNRALSARRQIGSLVKPAVYLTALMQPERWHLASQILDQPTEVALANGTVWAPENINGESAGQVSLLEALTRSLNQAAVAIGLEVGVEAVLATLRQLGVDHDVPALPSALLGAIELTPFEVAQVYQTLASDGFSTPLRAIRSVVSRQGEVLQRFPLQVRQQIPSDVLHVLQYALRNVMREGSGRRAYWRLPESTELAGKTGTSNALRDSWFAGFGGDYLGVVWIGRDDNTSTGLTGSRGALSVWSAVFEQLGERGMVDTDPEGVQYHWVDLRSGRAIDASCESARYIPYAKGSEPAPPARRRLFSRCP
ncbi:MAG: penicillin-binding protein 1B [Pseudomonadota bacterium]